MMSDIFTSLEFDVVKEIVSKHSSFSLGKELLLQQSVLSDALWIERELQRGREALKLYEVYQSPSFAGVRDLRKPFEDISKGRILHPQELYEIAQFARACATFKKYEKDSVLETPYMSDIMDSLSVYPHVVEAIEKCISAQWEVLNSASTELKNIRMNIQLCEADVVKTTQDFISRYGSSLMDTITAIRNGRTCVLVKTSDKNKIKGFVHGESASGQAVYIEPESLLRLNNKRQSLLAQETKEIQRILSELCAIVKPCTQSMLSDLQTITLLDVLFAKARWAFERCGVFATLSKNTQTIYFKDARHPLILEDKVVSNTYRLTNPYQHLLITGSNTGGKTVTLKTIGLFTILTLAGFPVLCEEGEVSCFDGVYVDIGDSQSIVESLSTFSAHLSKLADICQKATPNSLVLLDELGSGTDPQEGECLAIATLEYFKANNIMSIATTHYAKLKEYAKQEKSVLLASVAFDLDKMKPTYQYLEGYSGQSNALEIARRYHLHSEIVDRAYALKQVSKTQEQKLIETLDADLMQVRKQREELAQRLESIGEQEKTLLVQKQQFDKEKQRLLEEAKMTAYQIQEKAKEEAALVIAQLKELKPNVKEHEIIAIKSQLKGTQEQTVESKQEINFKVSDYVTLERLGYHGEILSIKGNRATVFMNGVKMNVKTNELKITQRPIVKSVSAHTSKRASNTTLSRECNVIGMRVEEALQVIDGYLDHALHSKVYQVRLVHGHGTGALRVGIHKYLKNNKLVASYRLGEMGEGGLGATVVTLKNGVSNG